MAPSSSGIVILQPVNIAYFLDSIINIAEAKNCLVSVDYRSTFQLFRPILVRLVITYLST